MKTLITLTLLAAWTAFSAPASAAPAPESAALEIEFGYRAVNVPVDGAQALFLEPGDRVDFLVTFEALMGKGGGKEMVTATILQAIPVLAVTKADSPDGLAVVRLRCNPNEAQYAALSLAQGKRINLVRRAPGDNKLEPMEIATFKRLFR